jgi:PucR family transcriptional regulator, purine catabolism regulatory protein
VTEAGPDAGGAPGAAPQSWRERGRFPSVADVLAMPVLRQGAPTVLVGGAALDREVRWVHSAEIADIAHLLRGGELVLTTGIALPGDAGGLASYAGALSTVGAVGLVVELGRRWTEGLPEALVEASRSEGLPLVTLSREVPFAAVTQTVGERIVDSQLAELRAAEEVHDAFTRLSVGGADPAEVLEEVARFCGLPVVLETFRGQVLGYHAGSVPAADLLADWDRRSAAVRPSGRTAYDRRAGWLVTVVGPRGDDWGRLVIVTPDPPPHRYVVLIERAAATLALHRLHARERDSVERQTHSGLLSALSTQEVSEETLTRCAGAGVPLTGRRLVGLALRPRLVGDTPTSTAEQALGELAADAAAAARACDVPALVAVMDDDVRMLVAHRPGRDSDAVVDEVARRVRQHTGGTPPIVAAGSTVESAAAAHRTLAEARHVVASAGPASSADRLVHRLEDVHVRGLLHLLGDDERVRAFVDREIGVLLRHDATSGTQLLDTVRALLDHPANKAAAASALHVSRPVFYERLAKAERLLGVDLADAEVRTSIHLALLANDGMTGP